MISTGYDHRPLVSVLMVVLKLLTNRPIGRPLATLAKVTSVRELTRNLLV